MVSSNVNRVLEEVVALTLDERRELLSLLETPPVPMSTPDIHDLVIEALRKEGITVSVPPPMTSEEMARYDSFRPVKIEGRPVSETLIEERR